MAKVESREGFNPIAQMIAGVVDDQIVKRNAFGAKLSAAESADSPETLDALIAGATDDERAQKMHAAIAAAQEKLAKMLADARDYAKANLVSSLSDDEKKTLRDEISSLDAQIAAGITLGNGQHDNFSEFFEIPRKTRKAASSATGAGSGISRPRLSKVLLDGKEITGDDGKPGTFTKLAMALKSLGSKKVGSELHTDALAALKTEHNVDSFADAAGKTVKFTETIDGKTHDIELTFKVSE